MLFPRKKARLIYNAKWRQYQNAKNKQKQTQSASGSSQETGIISFVIAIFVVLLLFGSCGWFG